MAVLVDRTKVDQVNYIFVGAVSANCWPRFQMALECGEGDKTEVLVIELASGLHDQC